jgi:hypothetical protein
MRVNRNFPVWTGAIGILAAVALTLSSVIPSDAFRSKSRHAAAATNSSSQPNQVHTLYTGLWRTDGGFVSSIRLKNVLAVATLDITPVIFMADGTPYPLRTVHLAISGVATVNINDALAAAPPSIASHISQYGSAALIYSYPSPGHVTAQVAAIDASRSLSFVFPFAEPMGEPMRQTVEVSGGNTTPAFRVSLHSATLPTRTHKPACNWSALEMTRRPNTQSLSPHTPRRCFVSNNSPTTPHRLQSALAVFASNTQVSRAAFKLQGGSKTMPMATPPTSPFGGMI